MGASDEQLDVFQELWCDALLSAGEPLPGRSLESYGTAHILHRSFFSNSSRQCYHISLLSI